MENMTKIFEELTAINPLSSKSLELLNKMMNIDSPMNFTNEFASEKDLERLEEEIGRLYTISSLSKKLKNIIRILKPIKDNVKIFI